MVLSPDKFAFRLTRIELLAAIETPSERLRPKHKFVVLFGDVINNSDKDTCVHMDQWILVDTRERVTYQPDVEATEEAKRLYGLDYPGLYLGLCVDYDGSEPTYYFVNRRTMDRVA